MNHELILGYPLLLVAALEVLLGALLFRQNRRPSRVDRTIAIFSFASAAFSLSTSLMYLASATGRDHILFARLSWIGWLSVPAALQFVFYLRDENSRLARIVGWTLYPFWSAVLLLTLFTDLVVTDHYVLIPFENHPGPMEKPLRFLGASMIVWISVEIIRLRSAVSGIKRAQLNYFFHGILIFGGLGALSAGFLQLLGGFGFEPGLTSYFSFPWVLLTFYAITRYRLFDIRIALSNTVGMMILFALVAASQGLLFHLLSPGMGSLLALTLSLLFAALLFFVTPLGSRVQAVVRRTVLGDRYLYQDILRESINAVVSILDFGELLEYIAGTVRKSLLADSVVLYLRGADGRFVLSHASGRGIPRAGETTLDPSVIDLIGQAGHALVREELERILLPQEFGDLNRLLQEIGAELVLPLRFKGNLAGVLTVGQKGNGEPFVQSDIDLLEGLAGHAAIAIENARLYEEAKRAHESLRESEARFSAVVEHSIGKALSQ